MPIEQDGLLCWPGFESAWLGLVERCGVGPVACYDFQQMIEVLMERDGMCADEAQEYLEFNYVGGYVGPSTPFVLYRLPMEELEHE